MKKQFVTIVGEGDLESEYFLKDEFYEVVSLEDVDGEYTSAWIKDDKEQDHLILFSNTCAYLANNPELYWKLVEMEVVSDETVPAEHVSDNPVEVVDGE